MTVALVIGGSSLIGQAIVQELCFHYDYVYATYHLTEVSSPVASPSPERIIHVPLDVQVYDHIKVLLDSVTSKHGKICALVYACSYVSQSEYKDICSPEYVEKALRINFMSAITACTHFVELASSTPEQPSCIVLIGSEAGIYGGDGIPLYAASKAALNLFAKGFARQIAPHNIRINVVSPGIVQSGQNTILDPAFLKRLPFKRAATTAEVAKAVSWLCSSNSSYTSGSVLSISGAR